VQIELAANRRSKIHFTHISLRVSSGILIVGRCSILLVSRVTFVRKL
jgi:hypothetical protein